MKPSQRKNKSGGSAGAGGYDYQAEAYALIAAKILAQEGLNNWIESGCNQIPVSVRMESGTGGDDLQIALQSGAKIELQVKSGLKKKNELWQLLVDLAFAVNQSNDTYGVLLTDTRASESIRVSLQTDIIKIGQGVVEELSPITHEFLKHIETSESDIRSLCARIRIVVRDFSPGTSGEAETLRTLEKIVANPYQAEAARSKLVADGMDLIRLKGKRDSRSILQTLKQTGIRLATSTKNLEILKQTFINWLVEVNDRIVIPSLDISLPISKAWVQLRAVKESKKEEHSKSLAEQIKDYHEWHQLASSDYQFDMISVEKVIQANRLMIVIGGPGSGKSTLLRKLTHAWSKENRIVLRVSLRSVSLRMRKGETFDEAILSVAMDGFSQTSQDFRDVLRQATVLLADGLDETDDYRSTIANKLRSWASGNNDRVVVVSTRPIDHNPAWFPGWAHFELVSLKEEDIREVVKTILAMKYGHQPAQVEAKLHQFTEKLSNSHKTASIAARNPQLLGFLIALFINGYNFDGNRFQLFRNVLKAIEKRPASDREYQQHNLDSSTVNAGADYLGWLMLNGNILTEEEIILQLGHHLAEELSIQLLQGKERASQVLYFWEERGLLERLSTGSETTYTFVHMTFRDLAATRFLTQFPEAEFISWILSRYVDSKYREVLLLLGGTERLPLIINKLLELDDPYDPVCTEALLAADILAEADDPPKDLRQLVLDHLTPRLDSNIPIVAYQTADKLRLIALVFPEFISSLTHELAENDQQWTKQIVCGLELLCGKNYVNENLLIEIYPEVSDTNYLPRARSLFRFYHSKLVRDLITEGGKYLIEAGHIDLVKEKYSQGNFSSAADEVLRQLLAENLSVNEFNLIIRDRFGSNEIMYRVEAMLRLGLEVRKIFTRTILNASERLLERGFGSTSYTAPDSQVQSLGILHHLFGLDDSPASELVPLKLEQLQNAFLEVVCGAILISSLNPLQVHLDAEWALIVANESSEKFSRLWSDSIKLTTQPDCDWSLADEEKLDEELLSKALFHPSGFICSWAALLLSNCFERAVAYPIFEKILLNAEGRALKLSALALANFWPEQACELILKRLEKSFVNDCDLLIESLCLVCKEDNIPRIQLILQTALGSRDAETVQAALKTIDEFNLGKALCQKIQNEYQWWLKDGPQNPPGGGVVPPNAAASLLDFLNQLDAVSFEDLFEALNISRSDVHQVAIKVLCSRLEQDEQRVPGILKDVANGKLPVGILRELSHNHAVLCQSNMSHFIDMVNTSNEGVQIASIEALSDGWAEQNQVEPLLRNLLTSSSPQIREEATLSLRRLKFKNKVV